MWLNFAITCIKCIFELCFACVTYWSNCALLAQNEWLNYEFMLTLCFLRFFEPGLRLSKSYTGTLLFACLIG